MTISNFRSSNFLFIPDKRLPSHRPPRWYFDQITQIHYNVPIWNLNNILKVDIHKFMWITSMDNIKFALSITTMTFKRSMFQKRFLKNSYFFYFFIHLSLKATLAGKLFDNRIRNLTEFVWFESPIIIEFLSFPRKNVKRAKKMFYLTK